MRHASTLTALLALFQAGPILAAAGVVPRPPAPMAVWRVEDVKPGLKGHGLTVRKGTRVEQFQAEVLGVLKNGSPGRDLIIAQLSGCGLEKTGVIAGMSGSPVYIEGKLLGAVAYAWPFGKEPIAGITPFAQMQSFADAVERREPVRAALRDKIRVGKTVFDSVMVAQSPDDLPADAEGAWLVPLRTPLAVTGFSSSALKLLARETARFGLVPVQGGAVSARVAQEEKDAVLEPGGPLSVALVTGDMDISGIGTVTHVEGNKVWGWGHPFMSLGGCQLPMYTGYIHAIFPRQTVSFKMGSPLREVGALNADVSTCIAGNIGKKADMLPMTIESTACRGETKTFNVRVVRHRSLMPSLIYTALTNSLDMEGELPEEMTAHLEAKIELDNGRVLTIKDSFSGMSGARAPGALFMPVASSVSQLINNPFKELRIRKVTCSARVEPGRSTAEIDAVALDDASYAPGDTIRADVWLRTYRGGRERVSLSLKLPPDIAPGEHTVLFCDEPSSVRQDIRNHPGLLFPSSARQVLEAAETFASARRTALVMRLPLGAHGVVVGGKALPTLPGSVATILVNSKRTGTLSMARAAVSRRETPWVIQGSDSVTFTVVKGRRTARTD